MIFSITNPTELVDWLQIFCKSGWLSPWDPPLQWGKIHERSYRPATHPIHFAADSPRQNPSLRCVGGIFLYGERTLKISWAVRTWYRLSVNAAAQTGVGTSFGANGDPITWAAQPLLVFLRLNNSETITQKRFWAQRWRARTVPWPQIFNFWKCCAPPGLHFFNASAFPKWSCWGAPAPNPAHGLHLTVRTATASRTYITSPRSYRTDRRYNDQNECSTDP